MNSDKPSRSTLSRKSSAVRKPSGNRSDDAPKKENIRLHAARVIANVMKGESLSTALPMAEPAFQGRDRSLLRQLCYTTLRHWFTLNAILDQLLTKPLKQRDNDVRALMLVGLCQLYFTRVAPHAAISESVGAAKKLRKSWANGLVNAVLRNAQREGYKLTETIIDEATKAELPDWLYGKLNKRWPEQLADIVAGTNSQAPMTLRVNVAKTSRTEYLKMLIAADIKANRCRFSTHGIQLEEPTDVQQLPGFNKGLVSVQDEAAQLSSQLLEPQDSERILDACAAPGGKTCHILESAENLDVTALDLEESRLVRVRENLERLQLNAKVIQGDASQPDQWWDGQQYDRILLDAPCSATGVIRRHPDIKLLRRAEDINQLQELQGRILDAMWSLLKPGGTMLYATCSILPEENHNQIKAFLARTDDAVHDTPDMECGLDTGYGLQLFPTPDSHDGFFYARLRKQP
ncbi:16S rRNA (cytosine(967)-C(5))-methyltransferase RsmB [Parendozoicomonas haliclonae]|uniref:16S rRNA (cytosine(967)-C(5))-methyltransferase n=1 Tax=Parendozoicomonas haliclonae TaxID=1960125 RepID=A0A1X7AJC2_9GAMM|nr:16S rRNA (cytosine(967)-C(5))-methyltransferase RsmB [Parendozoicomonas haliclonae]SMA46425.1 Ribosomal RNA small subunit methyltransferase B [Parendozoicomonas haliclonae]